MCFNPVLSTLASVSSVDFGIWKSEETQLSKTQIEARGLCCDWSPDGQLLAIGLYNGSVLIRDKAGDEVFKINRASQAPVWALAFCPQKFDTSDNILVMGSWD